MALLEYSKEGKIATFTINRPDAMNALNLQVVKELSEAMMEFRDDDDLWVGILTGGGDKAFCAGKSVCTDKRQYKPGEIQMRFSALCQFAEC